MEMLCLGTSCISPNFRPNSWQGMMDNDTEEEEQQAVESGDEDEGEARPPPVPPPHRTAAADILDRREAMLVQRAMDESLQQPVDHHKLLSTKVQTVCVTLR